MTFTSVYTVLFAEITIDRFLTRSIPHLFLHLLDRHAQWTAVVTNIHVSTYTWQTQQQWETRHLITTVHCSMSLIKKSKHNTCHTSYTPISEVIKIGSADCNDKFNDFVLQSLPEHGHPSNLRKTNLNRSGSQSNFDHATSTSIVHICKEKCV